MKKYLLLFCGIIFLLTGCSTGKIINLDEAKKRVQNYYDSGEYNRECGEVINNAIKEISALTLEKNSAVIFDIDDTALSNYEFTKKIGFGYSHSTWTEWMNSGNARAIPEVKYFYDWLVGKNIKVIFVTGRDEETLSATKNNLLSAGYTKFDTLIVRNTSEKKLLAAEYKSAKREELTKHGYKIIASIGDQASDLEGKFVGIKIKLPNYLYNLE